MDIEKSQKSNKRRTTLLSWIDGIESHADFSDEGHQTRSLIGSDEEEKTIGSGLVTRRYVEGCSTLSLTSKRLGSHSPGSSHQSSTVRRKIPMTSAQRSHGATSVNDFVTENCMEEAKI